MKKDKLKDIDLYFITDSKLTKKTILDDVKSAISGGVKIVQYREKEKPTKEMVEEALKIKKLCADDVIFLVNDRIDVALAVDADGVHLGQDDMPYETARKLLGDKIIGLTIHNVEEAVDAEKIGADYLGVSPIFATTTKLDAGKPAGIKLIEDVKNAVNIPFTAIGGINLENIGQVAGAGAKSAVAISAIVTKDDVEKEVKKFIEKLK
jgi:thiamine-phosphate pyrophosphorylase